MVHDDSRRRYLPEKERASEEGTSHIHFRIFYLFLKEKEQNEESG